MIVFLIFFSLFTKISEASSNTIKICEKAEINKPCDISCLSTCQKNCSICFYHEDDFGDISKTCCWSEHQSGNNSACKVRKKKLKGHTMTSFNFTLDPLLYEHYGEWFCGSEGNMSKRILLEPFYIELERTDVILSGNASFGTHLSVSGIRSLQIPAMLKIYIPCAYPRPSVTVAVQTPNYTCVICSQVDPIQFLEKCEIPGHIGSYNFTCSMSTHMTFQNSNCFVSEFKIVILVQQRGYTTGIKVFNDRIWATETLNVDRTTPPSTSFATLIVILAVLVSILLGYVLMRILKQTVQIKGKPSTLKGPIVFENVSDTSVTLRWNYCEDNGGSPITQYVIGYSGFDVEHCCCSTTNTFLTIKNLKEKTKYYFSLTAKNEFGSSDEYFHNSPVLTKGKPSSPKGPLHVTDITNTSMRLKWSRSEDDGGSPIHCYAISYECAKDGYKVQKTDKTEFDLRSLVQNTTYLLEVRAENIFGLSDSLRPATLVFTKGKPSTPKGPIVLEDVFDTSVTLSWNDCEYDGGSPISQYVIEYFCFDEENRCQSTTQTSFTIENLKENTKYTISLRAENQFGSSEKYFYDSAVLTKGRPSRPKGFVSIEATDTSIELVWEKPECDGGSPIMSYNIECSSELSKPVKHKTIETKYIISHLLPKTMYLLAIRAQNRFGLSKPLDAKEMTKAVTTEELVFSSYSSSEQLSLDSGLSSAQWTVDSSSILPKGKGLETSENLQGSKAESLDDPNCRAESESLGLATSLKTDILAQNNSRLTAKEAGNKVKVATDALVKEAREAKTWTEEEEKVVVNKRQVDGIAQEMSATEKLLKKTKELEQARQGLAKIIERYKRK